MHIILAVLGALAAALWAFTRFMNAANEGRDAISDVKGVIRRGQWNRRIDKRLIENLSDPREAAAILFYQIAEYDGAVTQRQTDAMITEMQIAFETDQKTAEGLYAFARMAIGEINDAGNNLRKILKPVNDICTTEEKLTLVRVLETVAETEGPINEQQRRMIDEIKHIVEL